MKKNWRMILLAVLISGLCLLNGCLTAWVTNTKQTRGNFYGALPAQEAVKMESHIIRNDFQRGRSENVLERERMLNTYVKRQLEEGTKEIATNLPSSGPRNESILGVGYPGIVINRDPYNVFEFVVTSLESRTEMPFLMNPASEEWFNLLSGRYKCQLIKNGIPWGPPSFFTVNGMLKPALGKKVYWFCTTP